MRIVFMGTPDFAVPCLERLIDDGHKVCGVFTRIDKPRGRGMKLCPTPVKESAQQHNIPVFQPVNFKDGAATEILRGLAPEMIVVTAYGRILPEAVLSIPPLGCVNVHASLLPAYRGAAPMQWSIIRGETRTGITTMYMAKGIDTGDIILKAELPIGPDESFGSLHDRMAVLGAQTLSETIALIGRGAAPRQKQDDAAASNAPPIKREDCAVDFHLPAKRVHDLVRGLSPVPAAFSCLGGRLFKLFETRLPDAEAFPAPAGALPGTVLRADKDGIAVLCGDGKAVVLTQLQQQGGRRMAAGVWLCGHPVAPGERFEAEKA